MSLQARRNSLFKSSISIKSISDSVQKFSKSLRGARKNADESIKTIRQSNIFKKGLIRNDDLYFRKRQENIKKKEKYYISYHLNKIFNGLPFTNDLSF